MDTLSNIHNFKKLTQRETEVLKLLAKFKCNKEIANDLSISESTAKAHISSILRKFNVYERAQCVIIGLKLGLIKSSEIRVKIRNLYE